MGLITMDNLLSSIDLPQAIAGIGLFLFAMLQLEQAMAQLLGGQFKRWLSRGAHHTYSALLTGTFSTAILQSSSLVGVMTLAFVGAGLIPLVHGIGIILGANLGTTMTGWLVTLLGFKLDLQQLALPLVALGSIGYMITRNWRHLHSITQLMLAIGLLIWALGLMKSSVHPAPEMLSDWLRGGGNIAGFFALGLLATIIIQSSSAMMLITLSLLATGFIDIKAAAAIVVGADLGTTGTVLLGAVGGSAPRRQVAYAHLWFNLFNAVIALLLIPLIPTATQLIGLSDPLFQLVTFHSTFNLIGVLMFYPFLRYFTGILERRVKDLPRRYSQYLNEASLSVPEAGGEALHRESERAVRMALARFRKAFRLTSSAEERPLPAPGYRELKSIEAEIIRYALDLQKASLNADQAVRLQDDLNAVRNAVHCAKCLKDIHHNLSALRDIEEGELQQLWRHIVENAAQFAQEISHATRHPDTLSRELLNDMVETTRQSHDCVHRLIFELTSASRDKDLQTPSLLNLNRELYTACTNLIEAVAEIYGAR